MGNSRKFTLIISEEADGSYQMDGINEGMGINDVIASLEIFKTRYIAQTTGDGNFTMVPMTKPNNGTN